MQRCLSCQGMIDPATPRCQACGRTRPVPSSHAPAFHCSACGELLPARAQFCRNCGQTQKKTKATRLCSSCGGSSPAAARFCGDCGKPFASATSSRLPNLQLPNTQATPGETVADVPLGLPRASAPADRRSYLLQPDLLLAAGSRVPGIPVGLPEEEQQIVIGPFPAFGETVPTTPILPAGPQVGAPNVPGIPAGPQIGAPNVPGIPVGPQVGVPTVPNIGAGPQVGASNVPGIPVGPQIGAPTVPGIPAGPQVGGIPHPALPGSPVAHPFSPPSGLGGGGGGGGIGGGGGGNNLPTNPTLPGVQGGPGWPPLVTLFPQIPVLPPVPPNISLRPRRRVPIPKVIAIICSVVVILSLTAGVLSYVLPLLTPQLSLPVSTFRQACTSDTQALPAVSAPVQNVSSDPVSWQAKLSDVDPAGTVWATLTPASGTLQPGSRAILTLTPAQTLCKDISRNTAPATFSVTLNFLQQSLTLKDSVTPAPTLALKVVQGTMPDVEQMCADTQALLPLTLTVDNTGSNVPVNWQINLTDTDPAGTIWATPSAKRGSVAAEKTTTLTLTPVPTLCKDLRKALSPAPYKASFTYTYQNQTQTTTFTDTVHPPMILVFEPALMTMEQTCNLLQQLPAVPITLDNSNSNVPTTWTLTISDTDPAGGVWASADRNSGTVDAEQQAMITLTPIASLCLSLVGKPATSFTIVFSYTGGGKSGQMMLMDTITPPPAVNHLQISPQTPFQQGCNSASDSLAPVQVTLDNRQSTVPVTWQTSISDTDPANQVWAAASPASDTVGAGQTETVSLAPIGALCADIFLSTGSLTYRASISQTALGQTNTVIIMDTVTPPPAVNNFKIAARSDVTQDCNSQSNPVQPYTIPLDNSQSNVAVDWSSAPTNWETPSPASGTIPAGNTATLTITPVAGLCNSLGVGTQTTQFTATISATALGKTNNTTIIDRVVPIHPVVKFTAYPQNTNQDCNLTFPLPAFPVFLDNRGSNVSVQWRVSITQTDPSGNIWATASSTSRTVGAGVIDSFTLTPFYDSSYPNPNLCGDLPFNGPPFTFTALITSTASTGQSGSITLTDNVTPFSGG